MPGGDGTGPMGMGAMTGRGMGYCSGYPAAGFANPRFGRGRGNRFWARATGLPGWYRTSAGYPAFRNMPTQAQTSPAQQTYPMGQMSRQQEKASLEQEMDFLKQQTEAINRDIESIQKRIKEIDKDK